MNHWLGTHVGNMVLSEAVIHIFKKRVMQKEDHVQNWRRERGWSLSGTYQNAAVEAVCRLDAGSKHK